MINFANKLTVLREANGFTQRKMALDLNLSHSAIALWENGKREPSFEMLEKLANYFNVSVNELLGIEQSSKQNSTEKILTEEQKTLIEKIETMNDAQCIRLSSYADRLIDEFREQEQLKNKSFR